MIQAIWSEYRYMSYADMSACNAEGILQWMLMMVADIAKKRGPLNDIFLYLHDVISSLQRIHERPPSRKCISLALTQKEKKSIKSIIMWSIYVLCVFYPQIP